MRRTCEPDVAPEGSASRRAGTTAAMKKLVIAMAVGAALAWAFDPDNGSRRRENVRRQLEDKGLLGSSRPRPPTSTRTAPSARRSPPDTRLPVRTHPGAVTDEPIHPR